MISRIERALLIKPRERHQFYYFLLFFLLIGAGMALGRGAAETLFYKRYGIEYLPLMYIVLGAWMMLISTLYAAVSDRIAAERFFAILFGLMVVGLAANWILITVAQVDWAYPLYFIFYEIASELLLVHASLYLSQNLDTLQSKRLSPLIFAGSQIGVIIGGITLASVTHRLGVHNILLLWGLLLMTALSLMLRHHLRLGTSPHFRPGARTRGILRPAVRQVAQGFKFMHQSELLRASSLALFFMVIAFYTLSFVINTIYTHTFTDESDLARFFGLLTAVNSSLALLMQILLANRLLERHGVKTVNLIFPATTLGSFGLLLISPSFLPALLGSFNKEAIMPAFRNPVANLFFNALPGYMQGRARAMSVILVLPVALALTGLMLSLSQHFTGTSLMLLIGLVAALGYGYYSWRMNQAYVASIVATLREKVCLPETGKLSQNSLLDELRRCVTEEDDNLFLEYTQAALAHDPQSALDVILPRLKASNPILVDQVLKHLRHIESKQIDHFINEQLQRSDSHLRANLIMTLVDRHHPAAEAEAFTCLTADNPRLRAAGIYGALHIPIARHQASALSRLHDMLRSDDPAQQFAAAQVLERRADPRYLDDLLQLLGSGRPRLQAFVLHALQQWPETPIDGLFDRLIPLHRHEQTELRQRVIDCAGLLPPHEGLVLSLAGLEDEHHSVRQAAAGHLFDMLDEPIETFTTWVTGQEVAPRAQDTLLGELIKREAPARHVSRLAYAFCQAAHQLYLARSAYTHYCLPLQNTPAFQVLPHIIQERQQLFTELSLRALEYIEDPAIISAIRAGFATGDSRHMAHAAEAIRYIHDRKLATQLSQLLDINNSDLEEAVRTPYRSLKEVLNGCRQHADPWLMECIMATDGQ